MGLFHSSSGPKPNRRHHDRQHNSNQAMNFDPSKMFNYSDQVYEPNLPYALNGRPPRSKPRSKPSNHDRLRNDPLFTMPHQFRSALNSTKHRNLQARRLEGKATKYDRSRGDPFIDDQYNEESPNEPLPRYNASNNEPSNKPPPKYRTWLHNQPVNDLATVHQPTTLNQVNHSDQPKPGSGPNELPRIKRAARLVDTRLHPEGVSKSNDPNPPKHAIFSRQRPTKNIDISGLREQITANAVALFQDVTKETTHPTDRFNISVAKDESVPGNDPPWVARLAVRADAADRSPPFRPAMKGSNKPNIEDALMSLLELTASALAQLSTEGILLLRRPIDPERRWNPPGATEGGSQGLDLALLDLEMLQPRSYADSKERDVKKTLHAAAKRERRPNGPKHRERD